MYRWSIFSLSACLALLCVALLPGASAACNTQVFVNNVLEVDRCTDASSSSYYTVNVLNQGTVASVGEHCTGNPVIHAEHECMTGVRAGGQSVGLQEGPGSRICVRVSTLCLGLV